MRPPLLLFFAFLKGTISVMRWGRKATGPPQADSRVATGDIVKVTAGAVQLFWAFLQMEYAEIFKEISFE